MQNDTGLPGSAAPSIEEQIREAELDRALAPYQALLTPEMLAHFREVLGDMLATHPVATRKLGRLKPAPVVEKSHPIEIVHTSDDSGSEEGDTKTNRSGK